MTQPLPAWIEQFFYEGFELRNDGVVVFTETETETSGDERVVLHSKYGSTTTPDDAALEVVLPWHVEDRSVWAVEVTVTVKSADAAVRQRVKITAIVYGDSGIATLDAAAVVVVAGTGEATATLDVVDDDDTMKLVLTPGTSTPLIWGFEVKAQAI